MPLCLGSLLPSLRVLSCWGARTRHWAHPELPTELWFEILHQLDGPELAALTRVNRMLNAIAVPMRLALIGLAPAAITAGEFILPDYRRDVFGILQTAITLPMRTLQCTVAGDKRVHTLACLTRLIGERQQLEDVQLTFYDDPFTGFGPPRERALPRRAMQRLVARLLNSITRPGHTLIIAGDRVLVSGAETGNLWSVVRDIPYVHGGRRAKVRKAVASLKNRPPPMTDLTLRTAGEVDGITARATHTVARLHRIHATYATSPADWSLVVLNGWLVTRLALTAPLGASAWARLLPLLTLPALADLTMGGAAGYGDAALHPIARADLDAFLVRHPTIAALEYMPAPAPSDATPEPDSVFSLASIPHLTTLTTTPAHFLHLHRAPSTFPCLLDLSLFAPAGTLTADVQRDFTSVLAQLSRTAGDEHTVRIALRVPAVWVTPPSPKARLIHCVASLVLYGPCAQDARALAEFLAPFEPGMRRVYVHDTDTGHCGTFVRMAFADEVQRRAPWLEGVRCEWLDSRVERLTRRKADGPGWVGDVLDDTKVTT
ncbi:hypothetical protein DFH09DRAFT_1446513 [Mycena vulgaris]|nr:hypothetical protein DFH09DRAFT_1446513 [Mycena vulgaris]